MASYSVSQYSVNKESLRETTLPLAALQSPFNSLNGSVTLQNAHIVCTRLAPIINHNHVKLFSFMPSLLIIYTTH